MIGRINQYNYQVIWSEEEKAYAGRCLEFPNVSWIDESRAGALSGIRKVIFDCVRYKQTNGESIPVPYLPKENMRT